MQAPWLASLLLAPLLVLAVPAEATDPAAPVQTVVDAVPVVARQAVDEARRDLTPDQARATVDAMQAFVRDFLALPDATGSDLASIDAAATYRFGHRVATVSQAIPSAVANVEAAGAGCTARGTSAQEAEVRRWAQQSTQGLATVEATQLALEQEADLLDLPIDASPLREAAMILREWREARGTTIAQCVEEAQILRGIAPTEARFTLSLFPPTSWRMGQVLAIGHGATGTITLDALGGTHSVDATSTGGYRFVLDVGPTAALGNSTIEARSGPHTAEAILRIGAAPSTLHLSAPTTVLPGASFQLSAQVTSPYEAGIGEGPISISSHDTASDATLSSGAATIRLQAPMEPGTYRVDVAYPGTSFVRSAEAQHAYTVPAPAAAPRGPQPPDLPSPTPGPAVALTIIAGMGLLVLATLVVQRLMRRKQRSPAPHAPPPTPAPPLPQGIVAAFSTFAAWLLARGLVPASATPREIGAWLKRRGIAMQRLVRSFEEARYGGAAEQPDDADHAAQRLAKAARRVEESG